MPDRQPTPRLRKRFVLLPLLLVFTVFIYAAVIQYQKWEARQKTAARQSYYDAKEKGDLRLALVRVNHLIETEPAVVRDHLRLERVDLNQQLGNEKAATDELELLIHDSDERHAALGYRALLAYRSGDFEKAAQDIEQIPLPGRSLNQFLLLGACKLKDDTTGAIAALSAGIEFAQTRDAVTRRAWKPRIVRLHSMRATAFALGKEWKLALDDLDTVLASEPDSVIDLQMRARVLCALQRGKDAESDARHALNLNEDAFGMTTLALTKVTQGDLASATRILNQTTERYPDSTEARDALERIRQVNSMGLNNISEGAWKQLFEDLFHRAQEANR